MRFSISVSPKSHSFNVFQRIFDEESKNRSLEGLRERIKDLLGKLTLRGRKSQILERSATRRGEENQRHGKKKPKATQFYTPLQILSWQNGKGTTTEVDILKVHNLFDIQVIQRWV